MSKIVDARGFSCPQPVLMFMDAARSQEEKEIIVLTDTEASRENVSKAAESRQYSLKKIEEQGDEFKLTFVKD